MLRTTPRRRETFNPRPTETAAKSYRVSAQSARGDLARVPSIGFLLAPALEGQIMPRACAVDSDISGGVRRTQAANRVRTRPIKLNVPAARLTLKNGTSPRAPS